MRSSSVGPPAAPLSGASAPGISTFDTERRRASGSISFSPPIRRRRHSPSSMAATGSRTTRKPSRFSPRGLLPNGINLALVEYTLAPAARMDRIVAELRRAVGWLAEHLGDYGADPARLYVAGHSAGGHLTAMTMPLGAVRGGLAISGLYDLEPIRLNYLNEKLGLDPEEAERNSPLLHLPPMAGELVVAYGTNELSELCRQSIDYAHAWTERGLAGHLLPIDGADHFTILDALADPQGALTRALLDMIDRR